MDLFAFVGFIGSGKDTVSKYLVQNHGYKPIAFADCLKDAVASIFCWPRDLLEGETPESRKWREEVDEWWAKRLDIPHFTPRFALQNFGTNVMRKQFSRDIWIMNVERRLLNMLNQGETKVVLTDCRFPNEIRLARGLGGKVIRVKRGPDPEWYDLAHAANSDTFLHAPEAYKAMQDIPIHESEWAWIGQHFDRVIENNGTLEDLYNEARALLLMPGPVMRD